MRSRIGLVHHHLRKFQIFLFRPEQHFAVFLLAHAASFFTGIFPEIIELNRMVEDGAELIVDGLEVYRGVRIAFLILIVQELVLPCDDLLGGDAAHLQLAEVWQQLGANDMLLSCPGVFLDASLHICRVLLNKALEGHIQIGGCLPKLFTLPSLCLSFGLESSLLRLLLFACPVGIAVDHSPCASLFFLINCHRIISFPFCHSRTFL